MRAEANGYFNQAYKGYFTINKEIIPLQWQYLEHHDPGGVERAVVRAKRTKGYLPDQHYTKYIAGFEMPIEGSKQPSTVLYIEGFPPLCSQSVHGPNSIHLQPAIHREPQALWGDRSGSGWRNTKTTYIPM